MEIYIGLKRKPHCTTPIHLFLKRRGGISTLQHTKELYELIKPGLNWNFSLKPSLLHWVKSRMGTKAEFLWEHKKAWQNQPFLHYHILQPTGQETYLRTVFESASPMIEVVPPSNCIYLLMTKTVFFNWASGMARSGPLKIKNLKKNRKLFLLPPVYF